MTKKEKLEALRKEWGYVELSRATKRVSGWRVWIVKNYSGRPIATMNGIGLPSNPTATRKLEYSDYTEWAAIQSAYRSVMRSREIRTKKRN